MPTTLNRLHKKTQCFIFFFLVSRSDWLQTVTPLSSATSRPLTFHVSQVEVSIHQRGSVIEVLSHVIQPVSLHALHTLVAAGRHLQRNLDGVVLDVALGRRRWSVVERQQLGTCGGNTPQVRGQGSEVRTVQM